MPAPLSSTPGGLPDSSAIPAANGGGGLSEEAPRSVAVPVRSPFRAAYDGVAFLFSAVLSPYIVIPVGTIGIVYARSQNNRDGLLYTLISIFFSTVLPALYVVYGMLRGQITDVHVMEREQRGGPFVVAIFSSIVSAVVLKLLGSPVSVWGLSVIIATNGLILWAITSFYKISMHVSVLSAVVLAAITLHPGVSPWTLIWMIPALIWARNARGRHTVLQGIAGCTVAACVTAVTLYFLQLGERIGMAIQRAT